MAKLRFDIEAEDRGSAEVDKLGRNVEGLDRDIDDLSRSLREQARAAGDSERSTRGLDLAVGGAVAAVGGLAAGFVALTRQQAEYHRLVERSAFVSNRSERDVEALIRTMEQYGVSIDATEDALRTFYDRLGDARADPNIEAAQIFRQIGLEIDSADVRLEDFLDRIQSFDRQSQIFIIETVLGGEGAAILQAAADANFQGNLEANLTLTLDPEDRKAILEADQAIERATQELGLSIDRLIASNSGLIEGFLEGSSQFLTGAAEIADSLPRVAQNIESALGDLSRGQFFAPTRRAAGGTPASSSADFFRPRQAAPPAPDAGRQLRLDTDASPEQAARLAAAEQAAAERQAAEELRQAAAELRSANALGMAESRARRGFRDAGLQPVGPGLTLEGEQVPVPGLAGVDPGAGAEAQVLLGAMERTLLDIHWELAEFLPEIASNTLGALQAAASFAASPNLLSLVGFGAQTVKLLDSILEQSTDLPVLPDTLDSVFEGGGVLTPAGQPGLGEYEASLENVLFLIGSSALQAEYESLQKLATDAWERIKGETDDSQERLELFDDFMRTEFAHAWRQFGDNVEDAWQRNRDALGLSEEQMLAIDRFITGTLVPDIDNFGTAMAAAWLDAYDNSLPIEAQLRLLQDFLGTTLPQAVNTFEADFAAGLLAATEQGEALEAAFLHLFETIGEGAGKIAPDLDGLNLSLEAILALLGDAGLSGEYQALQRLAEEAWARIRAETVDTEARTEELERFLSGDLIDSFGGFGTIARGVWERVQNDAIDTTARTEELERFLAGPLIASMGNLGREAQAEWLRIQQAGGTEAERLRQFDEWINGSHVDSWGYLGDSARSQWDRIKAATIDEDAALRAFDAFMSSDHLDSYGELGDKAQAEWERIKAATGDEEEAARRFDEWMNTEFAATWDAFGDKVVATWNRNKDSLGLSQEQIAALDDYVNNQLGPDIDAFGERAVKAWNDWYDEGGTLQERLGQIDEFLADILPTHLSEFEADVEADFAAMVASVEGLSEALGILTEHTTLAAGKVNVLAESLGVAKEGMDALAMSMVISMTVADALTASLGQIPTEVETRHTVTTTRRTVVVEDYGYGDRPVRGIAANPELGGFVSPDHTRPEDEDEVLGPEAFGGGPPPSPLVPPGIAANPELGGFVSPGHTRPEDEDEVLGPEAFGGGAIYDPDEIDDAFFDRLRRGGFQRGGQFEVGPFEPKLFLAGEGPTREVIRVTPDDPGVSDVGRGDVGRGGEDREQMVVLRLDANATRQFLQGEAVRGVREATERGEDVVNLRGTYSRGR